MMECRLKGDKSHSYRLSCIQVYKIIIEFIDIALLNNLRSICNLTFAYLIHLFKAKKLMYATVSDKLYNKLFIVSKMVDAL